ncbi:MAG: DUF1573 domain-containing protein [Saprospiraceae bacterium]
MMHFKKSLKSLSLIFTIVILFSACGGDSSSQNTTEDNSNEKVTSVEPKVVATSNTDIEKPAEPVKEKKKEVKEEAEEPVVEKPAEKKEVKKVEKKIPKKRAKMHFPEKVFDYGFIMQGDVVKHDFYFKNTGNADLVIKRVEPSCGCTVPIYPKEPIAPGEDGKISVTFKSAGKLGRQIPNIKVFTNYKRSIKLELKGFVDAEREKPRQVAEEVKDTTQQ